MPKPPDRVIVSKQETIGTGGDIADYDPMLNQPIDPAEDSLNAAGVSFQEPTGGGANSNDNNVVIYRENDKLWFEDDDHAGVNRVCLADLSSGGITPTQAGQVLVAKTDTEFTPCIPIIGPTGWLTGGGRMLVK